MFLPLLLASALFTTSSIAAKEPTPSSPENLDLICAISLSTNLKKTYEEKDRLVIPVFDEEADAKLLKSFDELMASSAASPANFRKFSVSFYKDQAKDEMALCASMLRVKGEICGDSFMTNDCDPTFSKRADGKALYDNLTAKMAARFHRVKSEDLPISDAELTSRTSAIVQKGYLVVGGFFLLMIGIFAYLFTRPQKRCPNCGNPFPRFRVPSDTYELLAGGWTCQKCGTKVTHGLKKRF